MPAVRYRDLLRLLLPLLATADAQAVTLCAQSEVAYFSCETKGGKRIAICGTALKRITNSAGVETFQNQEGYLQYRFGTKDRLELVYPIERRDSIRKFKGAYFLPAGAAHSSLSFTVGTYNYSVGITGGPGATAFTGVTIVRGTEEVASIACSAKPLLQTKNGLGFLELSSLLGE